MKKINCWEFKKCGRGPEDNDPDGVVCPAAVETGLNNTHGGLNAGRSCWLIEGCTCFNSEFSSLVQRYVNCMSCDFYILVRKEEGTEFMVAPVSTYIEKDRKASKK